MPAVRTPIKAPLLCYGSEYQSRNPVCLKCPHSSGCRSLMTNPDGVYLTQVKFDLMPESARIARSAKNLESTAAVYARAYRKVYGLHARPDRPNPETCAAIEAATQVKGCSVEMFCLIGMIVRKMTGAPFYAAMLTGNYADRAFDVYHSALAGTVHRFDLKVIQELTGVMVNDRDFVERFAQSETILGLQVIESFSIGIQDRKRIMAECYTKLDPIWKSVNPDYAPTPDRQTKDFRMIFKRKASVAAQAFHAWQQAMPIATLRVLAKKNMDPRDMVSRKRMYTDTFEYWAACGYVFQHLAAIDLISRSSRPHGQIFA